ncbi:MAG: hypothetical protein VYB71_03470 [Chloroflexota bacterium]|nr:hypothetical protein [Chloroflexota bacterium]
MLTSKNVLGISREVFLAMKNDNDKDRISIGDEPREAFTLLSKLDIEQAGDDPGQAVLFLALLEDETKASNLKSVLSKLIEKL